MADLSIPERHRHGLELCLALDDKSWQQLIRALAEMKPVLRISAIIGRIAPKLSNVPLEDLEQILTMLLAIPTVRQVQGESIEAFTESLLGAWKRGRSENARRPDGDEERLRSRILGALQLHGTLELSAKARDLLAEQEHALCSTRVMTDARPVFSDNPSEPPAAVVLFHTMKISYHAGRHLKDYFVAMDTEDVRRLKAQLERAEQKAESLKEALRTSSVICIEPE